MTSRCSVPHARTSAVVRSTGSTWRSPTIYPSWWASIRSRWRQYCTRARAIARQVECESAFRKGALDTTWGMDTGGDTACLTFARSLLNGQLKTFIKSLGSAKRYLFCGAGSTNELNEDGSTLKNEKLH